MPEEIHGEDPPIVSEGLSYVVTGRDAEYYVELFRGTTEHRAHDIAIVLREIESHGHVVRKVRFTAVVTDGNWEK
jgi:hypothetical protein